MENVKRKILVLSGKGGVGKSTFTAQLAWAFAADDNVQVRPISLTHVISSLSVFYFFSPRLELWT